MDLNLDPVGKEGLRFYGKISASISHEMKNILAVLNENAGLLEDLLFMTKKGASLDIDRIASIAESMKKQIRRGDLIAKNLNTFAHSVDEFNRAVNVFDVLTLVVSLTRRFADMKGVVLNLNPVSDAIEITTHPFFLEQLLWCCLDMAIARPGQDKTIGLEADTNETGVQIIISGLGDLSEASREGFPGHREFALLDVLKAQIKLSEKDTVIRIALPKKIVN